MKCAQTKPLLFDYAIGELGRADSDRARKHLKKCPACKAAVAEIKGTLQALRAAARLRTGPSRLSNRHRAQIRDSLLREAIEA